MGTTEINVANIPEMGKDSEKFEETPRDINEVIKNAGVKKASSFCNANEVDKGLKKVSVVGVMKAYDKIYPKANNKEAKTVTYLDILIKSLSDYRKDEELTFSLNPTQVVTLKGFFGDDPVKWKDKILRLVSAQTGLKNDKGETIKTIVIDKD